MSDLIKGGKRFNILLSILIAVLLWFYVVNVENPAGETVIPAVPVEVVGADTLAGKGLMVTELNRETVNLKATGKRKTFLKFYKSEIALMLDVSGIETAGEHRVIGKVTPETVRSDGSVTLSERDNFAIMVTVQKKESREIPIRAEFKGTYAEGFAGEEIQITPQTIEVSGPQDEINRVSYALVTLEGEDISQTIQTELPYALYDQDDKLLSETSLIRSVETLAVTLPVYKLYELPLSVTLQDGGGATAGDAKVDITPSTIKLSGPEEILSQLQEITLGEMRLADVFGSKTKTFPITIPQGVTNRSGETEASVTVNVDNVPMKAVIARQISLVNTPKGYKTSLVNDSLQVWVRGAQEQLDHLSAVNLRVVVDLKGVTPRRGQQRAEAQVYVEGINGVGVVGSDYTVAISMK